RADPDGDLRARAARGVPEDPGPGRRAAGQGDCRADRRRPAGRPVPARARGRGHRRGPGRVRALDGHRRRRLPAGPDPAGRPPARLPTQSTKAPARNQPPITNPDEETVMFVLLKDVPVVNHPVFRIMLGAALAAAGLVVLHHNVIITAAGAVVLIMGL